MARGGRQEVLAAVTAYRRATRDLRSHLDDVDAGLETFVSLLKKGLSVTGLLVSTDASARRLEFVDAMSEFEDNRRRLRVALLRLGAQHGESVADMARAVGISRQLAYRLMAEEP